MVAAEKKVVLDTAKEIFIAMIQKGIVASCATEDAYAASHTKIFDAIVKGVAEAYKPL